MRQKGFTLVELLAVIVILSIISIITVPVIINMVNESREKAFENSGPGILDAVRNYQINHNNDEVTVNFSGGVATPSINFNGTAPTTGEVHITESGRSEYALWSDSLKMCIAKCMDAKKLSDSLADQVRAIDKASDCKINQICE